MIKTTELKGRTLDWAVEAAILYSKYKSTKLIELIEIEEVPYFNNWDTVGPLIKEYKISIFATPTGWSSRPYGIAGFYIEDDDLFAAVTKCFIYSVFGKEVDVPLDLL